MNSYGVTVWSRSLVIAVDVVVVVWLAAMLALGGLIKAEIDRLAATADSMTQVAQQESDIAAALAPLQALPFEGDQIANARQELLQASHRTLQDASVTGAAVHQLAGTAFLVVVLLAVFPVLVFYLPMRLNRHRARRDLRGRRRAAA